MVVAHKLKNGHETHLVGTLSLYFPAPQTMKNKGPWFKPPTLWFFETEAPTFLTSLTDLFALLFPFSP